MSILLLYKARLGLILRCHFYNVISLAVRSRLCFMFSTDFYWCVFSKFFFLLQCSSQLCIAFCYLVLIQKRHSTSSCENSHSRVRVCSSACRILEADQKRVRGKGKSSQEILQRAGGDEPLCCCWVFFKSCNDKQQLYIILGPFNWFISTLSSSFIFSESYSLLFCLTQCCKPCLTNEWMFQLPLIPDPE